jgi:hypothetical protein
MTKKINITIAVTEKELAALNYCVYEFILLAQSDLKEVHPLKRRHLKRANKVGKRLLEQYNININSNNEADNNAI